MTLTLEINPNAERELQQRASVEGIPLPELAAGILETATLSPPDNGIKSITPAESSHEAVVRAREFYDRELRDKLEASHLHHYVAIHPDSGDYLVERGPSRALHAMVAKHPSGPIIVRHIGVADSGLKARIKGDRP